MAMCDYYFKQPLTYFQSVASQKITHELVQPLSVIYTCLFRRNGTKPIANSLKRSARKFTCDRIRRKTQSVRPVIGGSSAKVSDENLYAMKATFRPSTSAMVSASVCLPLTHFSLKTEISNGEKSYCANVDFE
uniref:Uncharacterized protein n=1 Tax=Romanomermis culicivorax TaxID=13658 RepID=A0A915JBJ9_ROMCU